MLKKGLIAGLVNLVLGLGLNFGFQAFFPELTSQYQNSALFRPWTDPLMMIYFAHPFILGLALTYLWGISGKNLTGGATTKAFRFAKLVFLVATIPGMFITYTSFRISLLMVSSWTLVGFLEAFAAGWVFAKIK